MTIDNKIIHINRIQPFTQTNPPGKNMLFEVHISGVSEYLKPYKDPEQISTAIDELFGLTSDLLDAEGNAPDENCFFRGWSDFNRTGEDTAVITYLSLFDDGPAFENEEEDSLVRPDLQLERNLSLIRGQGLGSGPDTV